MLHRKRHTALQAVIAAIGALLCLSTSANSEADTLARASMTVALQIQGSCSITITSHPVAAPTVGCDFAEPYDMQWSTDDITTAAEPGHAAYWTVVF